MAQGCASYLQPKEALSPLDWQIVQELLKFLLGSESLLLSQSLHQQCCPEFDLTSLQIHGNKLLKNNYLRTSLKTALFFNPIRAEIAAHNFRMIYLSILICCYITGHFLHRRFHQSSSHLSASATRTPLTGPRLLFILQAVSHSCQF